MKKFFIIFLLLLNTYSFSQSYLHITELRGLEDSLGNTQLFYRYVFPGIPCWIRSVYHFDVNNVSDSLFIYDAASDPIGEGCRGQYVYDYEFLNDMISEFVYGGLDFYYDAVPIFVRYDGSVLLPQLFPFGGSVTEIEFSPFDNSLIYLNVIQFYVASYLLKSTDSGYNFFELNTEPNIDYYIISLSKNNYSQIYGIDNNKLVRSEDDGLSYVIVDNSYWAENSELYYDADGEHIYGLSGAFNFQLQTYLSNIYVSDDDGNPFTWNSILEYQGRVWFANDEINTGEIYFSAGNKIFKSTDFGNSFLLYRQLDRNITGLYKKSGTNVLYASIPLRIYEITPDTIQVIKNLSVPEMAFKFYPLEIGNRWVYNKYTYIEWNTYHDIYIREITRDTVLSNGKKYYQIEEYDLGQPYLNYSFERMDSSQGMIYRYDNTQGLPEDEYLIDDLLAIIGDTIQSFRMGYPWIDGYTLLLEESIFAKWGLSKSKKIFEQYDLMMPRYSLTQDIGLDSLTYSFDFGYTEAYLKGCVIDGVVLGDTTVVSVEDEENSIATSFKLEQNYPNPFNPTTKIGFRISEFGFVSLKIYDILGNEIATLVNEELSSGEYEVEFNSASSIKQLASGIYFYQLKSGSFVETKKMLMIK